MNIQKPKIVPDQKLDPLISDLANSKDIPSACLVLKDYLSDMGFELLSVKFCDIEDELPAIRPFGNYPCAISELSTAMYPNGGCPLTKEAIRVLYPFDAFEIHQTDYPDFLSRRFLQEIRKMAHEHIAVVPIILGRGLALFTIGLANLSFAGQTRELIISTVSQSTILLIGRFPEIANFFSPKCLSLLEAEILFLSANGFNDVEIGEMRNFGALTVNMIFNNAARKLNARNRSQAISTALSMGEISNTMSPIQY